MTKPRKTIKDVWCLRELLIDRISRSPPNEMALDRIGDVTGHELVEHSADINVDSELRRLFLRHQRTRKWKVKDQKAFRRVLEACYLHDDWPAWGQLEHLLDISNTELKVRLDAKDINGARVKVRSW